MKRKASQAEKIVILCQSIFYGVYKIKQRKSAILNSLFFQSCDKKEWLIKSNGEQRFHAVSFKVSCLDIFFRIKAKECKWFQVSREAKMSERVLGLRPPFIFADEYDSMKLPVLQLFFLNSTLFLSWIIWKKMVPYLLQCFISLICNLAKNNNFSACCYCNISN